MTSEVSYGESMKGIRTFLTKRRKALGLSQRELSSNIGCAQSVLSDLETGKNGNPGFLTLQRWSQGLGLNCTVVLEEATLIRFSFPLTANSPDSGGAEIRAVGRSIS